MSFSYEKAKQFIYRNARPLDFARWQYQFEHADQKIVLQALAAYQNEDGGFGHALEADSWNPNSAPIQTWNATEILRESEFTDREHPIIQGIMRYLESGAAFDGKFWYNTINSNNLYPHAPWWHTENESASHNNYNPTACLAGFIIRFASKNSALYKLGSRIAKDAFKWMIANDEQIEMHTLVCFIRLMEYIEESGETKLIDLGVFKEKLKKQVQGCITQNTKEWGISYICKPSQFFCSRKSLFYEMNKEIAEYECEFIVNTQLEDGTWNIPWNWSDFPDAWAISKNWWKSNLIIWNMIYLRNFSMPAQNQP